MNNKSKLVDDSSTKMRLSANQISKDRKGTCANGLMQVESAAAQEIHQRRQVHFERTGVWNARERNRKQIKKREFRRGDQIRKSFDLVEEKKIAELKIKKREELVH